MYHPRSVGMWYLVAFHNKTTILQDLISMTLIQTLSLMLLTMVAFPLQAVESPFSNEQIQLWMELAKGGHKEAQYNLGVLYHNGWGLTQDDTQAAYWWTRSSQQGGTQAQLNLGQLFYSGDGVKQDYDRARVWWTLAAAQGNAAAQHNLAILYENGLGVPRDAINAVSWYKKAAEQGLPEAQNNLGHAYYNGDGTLQSYLYAYIWWQIAAIAGNAESKHNLELVTPKLTEFQIFESIRLANKWMGDRDHASP